jgi:flagellar export protein FliJ
MARFHFPLEKVLRWRAVELADEEAKLKRLVQEELRLQSLRAEITAERSNLISSASALPDLRGDDLRTMAVYSHRLRRKAENLTQQLVRSESDLAAQRKNYSEAKRRMRLLEELKERKLEKWRYEQARLLEQLASESYLATWNRERF